MWKWLKLIGLLCWLACVFFLGMWMQMENAVPVDVNFFGFVFHGISLGYLLCSMIFIGALLGAVTTSAAIGGKTFIHKRKYKKANKEIEKLKAQQ